MNLHLDKNKFEGAIKAADDHFNIRQFTKSEFCFLNI